MRLKVLGSGSSGNCYLLESETECLIIEAGISIKEVKKALDFNIRKIVGVIVSHVHKDHSRFIEDYEHMGIPIFKPYEDEKFIMPNSNFLIKAFPLTHLTYNKESREMQDCPCFGFFIKHSDMGSLIYASDTEYIRWIFQHINHFLVECNYDMKNVDKSVPYYEHILRGHMSLDTCKEFLKTNNSTSIRNVILCHLSSSNSNENEFLEEISKVVNCSVKIAKKDLQVDLELMPF